MTFLVIFSAGHANWGGEEKYCKARSCEWTYWGLTQLWLSPPCCLGQRRKHLHVTCVGASFFPFSPLANGDIVLLSSCCLKSCFHSNLQLGRISQGFLRGPLGLENTWVLICFVLYGTHCQQASISCVFTLPPMTSKVFPLQTSESMVKMQASHLPQRTERGTKQETSS